MYKYERLLQICLCCIRAHFTPFSCGNKLAHLNFPTVALDCVM